jgi:tryptophan synthase alpha chain
MKSLETKLRAVRDSGRKALVPYFMAGLTPDWTQHVEAAVHAGADAVEIGIPFSDPIMDGVVIQEAALTSLARGTNLDSICADLAKISVDVPLITMTYFNIFHHYGLERSIGKLTESGIEGAIVPDLSLEESGPWSEISDSYNLANIFLVAPSTSPERAKLLAQASEGFCYAAARMAVTGKASDEGGAEKVVAGIRAGSDIPTYVGIGISTPEQAKTASLLGDGVIVGSALVQLLNEGAGPDKVEKFITSFRRSID